MPAMKTLQNTRFLQALKRQPVDRTPVWMMRQAGRYLPEYRKLRAEMPDFLSFCQQTDMAAEVTVQPINRFPTLDAAIVFSDILTIPAAMGLDLVFLKDEGPCFSSPIQSMQAVKQLDDVTAIDKLNYVFTTIKKAKIALNQRVPLIGFAGSPWTVGCYMVEGRGSKTFQTIKTMLYRAPDILHALLSKLADCTAIYLNQQIDSGADAIMLFDTWGGVLTESAYQIFSLQYMTQIISQLKRDNIPVIMFTKNGGQWLESMLSSGADALGLDWTANIHQARKRVGHRVALQGNMDPLVLFGTPENIQNEVRRILADFGDHPGHVFNLGHGILPQTPIESVEAMLAVIGAGSK
ncbi:MAG: uroporphyrinogen decarboxylase [Gammaproteobacteria bacterium RIFCSPHIGHO2_12_FULL_41_15]|nr:MAG: uroporphyrinogen decarboxylase [Gammaproteobacteria bacterium RIFCSPHIGHO2_12_FULL_41_15]